MASFVNDGRRGAIKFGTILKGLGLTERQGPSDRKGMKSRPYPWPTARRTPLWILAVLSLVLASAGAQAGVFTTPHYIEERQWSLGVEPELTIAGQSEVAPGTSSTGVAITGRFTYGINELSNVALLLGTGGGPKQFRAGGVYTFDFFPDIAGGQPGIGLAVQGMSLSRPVSAQDSVSALEVTGIPSVRKLFHSSTVSIEPYLAFPMGWRFQSQDTSWTTQAVFGALVQASNELKYTFELGMNVSKTESYFSTGLTYFWAP